jgi:hypothetical protein
MFDITILGILVAKNTRLGSNFNGNNTIFSYFPQAGFGQISPLNRPNLDNSQLNLFLKVSDMPLKNIILLQRNII